MRVTFGKACILGGIEASIHTRENGEASCGRQSEFALSPKLALWFELASRISERILLMIVFPFLRACVALMESERFWRREAESNRR
jgi:hypothetical protein